MPDLAEGGVPQSRSERILADECDVVDALASGGDDLAGLLVVDFKADIPIRILQRLYPADAPPLFFGHYWLPFEEKAKLIAPNVACLDFSVAKDGALFAYRWDGERTLDTEKMVFARERE